jgi:hypothetical protein
LHLASGASKTLLDTNECGPDNLVYERCVHYHFLGHLQKQQFFLLSESFYEGANFVLIDEVTGELQRFGDLRAGFGNSDTGISGFRARHLRDRRSEIHEEAKT